MSTLHRRRLKRTIRLAIVAAVIGIAGLLIAQDFAKRSVEDRIAGVRGAIDGGRLDEAELRLKTLPESSESSYLLARLELARNRPPDAIKALNRARKLGYPEKKMEGVMGLVLFRSGEEKKAEPLLSHALEATKPLDPEIAEALVGLYYRSFRYKPAIEVVNRWLSERPDDIKALIWRAEVHSRNDAGASRQIEDLNAVLKRDPTQLPSRLDRAGLLRGIGRLEEAKSDYDIYLNSKPEDAEGHLGAAKTAEGLDDEDSAESHYEQALTLNPGLVEALLGKSAILLNRKKPDEALRLIDRAVKLAPNDPETHYRRSVALDRLGRREEAKRESETRARLQEDFSKIEKIRKDLVRNPSSTSLQAEAAQWLLSHNYDEEGLIWARKTLASAPDHAPTLKLLASYYENKGQPALARFYRLQVAKP